MLEPWWKNFFYNMATVQLDHRLVAWLLLALTVIQFAVRRFLSATARRRPLAGPAGRWRRRGDWPCSAATWTRTAT